MAKHGKGYLNLGLPWILNIILAIIPVTSWILGGITRIFRGHIIAGILQFIPLSYPKTCAYSHKTKSPFLGAFYMHGAARKSGAVFCYAVFLRFFLLYRRINILDISTATSGKRDNPRQMSHSRKLI